MLRFMFFIIFLLSSQMFFLWAFALDEGYFVIQNEAKQCGLFQKWNATSPNWLPFWWQTIQNEKKLYVSYLQDALCEMGNTSLCCKNLWYNFVSRIGEANVSETRRAAEFLASKKIIESKSLMPDQYFLENGISRKEFSKIMMNISGKEIVSECQGSFWDVPNDWSCKYIESALKEGFIVAAPTFRPNDSITQTEAIKLILQARNIEKRYNTSSWQQDYISTAYYLWLIDEKFSDYNITASRGWIFQLSARTYSDF